MTRSRKIKMGGVAAILLMAVGVYFFFFTAPRELKIDAMALAARDAVLDEEKTNTSPDGTRHHYGYVLTSPQHGGRYLPSFAYNHLADASLLDRIRGLFGPGGFQGLDDRDPYAYDRFEFDASELYSRVGDVGADLLNLDDVRMVDLQKELEEQGIAYTKDLPKHIHRRNDTGQKIRVVLVTLLSCRRYSATIQVDYRDGGGSTVYILTRRPGQPWQIADAARWTPAPVVLPTTQPTSSDQ